jgi:hypothetical protein
MAGMRIKVKIAYYAARHNDYNQLTSAGTE